MLAQGLAAFGIDKATLQLAGLSAEAITHLHRALYVYTIGFQDKVRKLFGPIEHKQVPLNNIWRAYLAIAEIAMKVGFKVCNIFSFGVCIQKCLLQPDMLYKVGHRAAHAPAKPAHVLFKRSQTAVSPAR